MAIEAVVVVVVVVQGLTADRLLQGTSIITADRLRLGTSIAEEGLPLDHLQDELHERIVEEEETKDGKVVVVIEDGTMNDGKVLPEVGDAIADKHSDRFAS